VIDLTVGIDPDEALRPGVRDLFVGGARAGAVLAIAWKANALPENARLIAKAELSINNLRDLVI